ncbi:MAG: galactose mutarotase [Flavobacteriaceae bacterium]|nr:galactose mutarotase [Pelagibacterales bacterium]MBT4959673.1 galactose mutarotase [Flavobacteriaceae bacterium]MBT6447470.1 galactose mutarotase [Flavobacteriaceae bacterium]
MKKITRVLLILIFLNNQSCNMKNDIKLLNKSDFQKNLNGKKTDLFILRNKNGIISELTNYGARVVSLWVPDINGSFDDIVLGCSTLDDYISIKERYFGATIGRYANRIKNGKFKINNTDFILKKNNGPNHLHGGNIGYNDVVWEGKQLDNQTVEFKYLSKNMEEGYPGNLNVKVIYHLSDQNELKIEYFANTDEPTYVNLTHHSFFNLLGAGNGNINNHLLYINAKSFTPIDSKLIPTGKIELAEGTPFDFNTLTKIGKRLNDEDEQLKFGNGYDHNFVLNNSNSTDILAARVIEKKSGRILEVYTNEPGMQLYGGNFLDGKTIGKQSKAYNYRSAFCLETQHFPDSPNNPNFPNTLLKPKNNYYSICIYKFLVKK